MTRKQDLFAVVDIETTGGNMRTDRITEIAIIVHNGQRVIEEYSTLVNPLKPIQPFVSALTGISNEMVIDAPTFNEVVDKIEELTTGRIFVAHNVRFDYGFLKNEYRRTGKTFRRKLLCTVTTSKHVFPELPSYGLGNICRDLNIDIYDRHRAHGDASATAILLEKLIFNDKKKIIKDLLKGELAATNLPSNISKDFVDELPEETGVYYFHNEKGEIIYVGKSKNIRDRVIAHFRNDANTTVNLKMNEQIYSISYDVTGDELVALLKESDEIKRWMPQFNRIQRRQKYRYGIFLEKDNSGYYDFDIELLNPERQPFHKFRTKQRAETFLDHLMAKNNIAPTFKKTYDAKAYNKRVDSSISRYRYPYSNFLIIGHGRVLDERSVVQIKDGNFVGFGFFDPVVTGSDMEAIVGNVNPYHNNPDVSRIILSYMRKYRKRVTILEY
ncbi:MAG: GIY-YIG nuclease family protein [Bacteroidetes bacterium]|nr:GIY-YIG nuclease family protein [Bacteroidota bacterium]